MSLTLQLRTRQPCQRPMPGFISGEDLFTGVEELAHSRASHIRTADCSLAPIQTQPTHHASRITR